MNHNMNKTEFTERLQALGTEADETQRRELIAQLIEEGGNDYDDHAAAVKDRDKALQDCEDLRSANMKLFLRVGGDRKDPTHNSDNGKQEKRKFNDLFNEKGGLK